MLKKPFLWILVISSAVVAIVAAKTVNWATDAKPPELTLEAILQAIEASDKNEFEKFGRGESPLVLGMSEAISGKPRIFLGVRKTVVTSAEILFESVPHLIPDLFEIRMKVTVVLNEKGLGKTPRLLQQNGNALPSGTYKVSLSCKVCEEKFEKMFFVGPALTEKEIQKVKSQTVIHNNQLQKEVSDLLKLAKAMRSEIEGFKKTLKNGDRKKFESKIVFPEKNAERILGDQWAQSNRLLTELFQMIAERRKILETSRPTAGWEEILRLKVEILEVEIEKHQQILKSLNKSGSD